MAELKCAICESEGELLGPVKSKQNHYFCCKCIFGISNKNEIRLPMFKKGEQYQIFLQIAEYEKIAWEKVTEFIRDLLFTDWPVENGRKIGYKRAIMEFEEYKEKAKFLNRFASWKSTNFIYYNKAKR